MCTQIDKLVTLYKTLSNTPVLTKGRISKNRVNVIVNWTQRCIERRKYVLYSQIITLDDKSEKIAESLPFDTSNEILSQVCPSEKYRAVIREVINEKDGPKQYLEIWNNNFLQNVVDLTTLNMHGTVYSNLDFSALEWSPDESKVMYIAEKKLLKYEPFYKRKSDSCDNCDDNCNPTSLTGEEFVYRQEWGETYVGKSQSVIAVYDVIKDNVKILEGIPEHFCPGQVIWSPDGQNVIGVAWETRPRKLGLAYCTNRPNKLFSLDLNGNFSVLSEDDRSVCGPMFSPDGKYLLWLDQHVGGPHRSAMTLKKLENPFHVNNKPSIVIGAVETEMFTTEGQPFYGLYNIKFPQRCWTNDNLRLIFSTVQKFEIKSFVLNISTSQLTELKYGKGSLSIIDVFDDKILATNRNYVHTDSVLLGILPGKGSEENINWKTIHDSLPIIGLENCTHHYLNINHNNNDLISTFNAIYFGPKHGCDKSVPLIIWPHGGPHMSFFNAFSLESSMFASLGFAICFVNYRGSLGAGQKSLEFLLERVGDADVKDCLLAAQECCKEFPWIDPNKLLLNGGSHGGFLVHHLSGQHPDMFKAVVSRNPVIDIATKSIISDNPDKAFIEIGSKYTQTGPVDDELFLQMRKRSPIQYAHQIKAPTYLMVGSKDLRVPPTQSIDFYHRLKANNVAVKMNIYDDNHSLACVPHEMNILINTILWFSEHAA